MRGHAVWPWFQQCQMCVLAPRDACAHFTQGGVLHKEYSQVSPNMSQLGLALVSPTGWGCLKDFCPLQFGQMWQTSIAWPGDLHMRLFAPSQILRQGPDQPGPENTPSLACRHLPYSECSLGAGRERAVPTRDTNLTMIFFPILQILRLQAH